jgi:hypothetical protein
MSATVRKPRPFKLTQVREAEHPMQTRICGTLKLEIAPPGRVSGWGVCWWAIDIANYGGRFPATRMARGLCAGIPDLFLMFRGRAHFIELKARDGILSDPQQSVIAAILASGGQCGIACDEWDTLRLIDAWHIPRAGRVHFPVQRNAEAVA